MEDITKFIVREPGLKFEPEDYIINKETLNDRDRSQLPYTNTRRSIIYEKGNEQIIFTNISPINTNIFIPLLRDLINNIKINNPTKVAIHAPL